MSIVRSGVAVTTAARTVGVDPVTGMAWAAWEGISTEKRPSTIRGKAKVAMVRALRAGASKDAVARLGRVSVQSVTRLLRTEVGLQSDWHAARAVKRKHVARSAWLQVVSQNPLAGATAGRMLEPAAYAWLYRNDRDWLKEQIGQLERVARSGGVRVNWDERDRLLAAEVTRACLELAQKSPGKRVKLWQLFLSVPTLRPKLAKLDHLPLTEKAIRQAVSADRERGIKETILR